MPVKPLKSSKKRLGASKSLPNFRTMTMVKVPGNLSAFKPPVDVNAEDDRKDRSRDDE
jgi:hypothetical protein